MRYRSVFVSVLVFYVWGAAPIQASASLSGPVVSKEVEVAGSLEEVWKAWTSNEGVQTFFAPAANIDPTVGGHYEIFFAPDQPYGFRGADGNKVQDIVPQQLLVFTWNAPPQFGVLRNLHTLVSVRLERLDSGLTRVTLNHIGFGQSPQWLKLHEYFTKAWEVVLSRLRYRFEHGPVNWSNPPAGGPPSSGDGQIQ